jgi:hypothetical protein
MLFEEIIPHLNKMASVYLVNNRRRTGYLFADTSALVGGVSREVVYFLTVMKSHKVLSLIEENNFEKIEEMREEIPVSDIIRIKSIDL